MLKSVSVVQTKSRFTRTRWRLPGSKNMAQSANNLQYIFVDGSESHLTTEIGPSFFFPNKMSREL
jgi:hypothetical protein